LLSKDRDPVFLPPGVKNLPAAWILYGEEVPVLVESRTRARGTIRSSLNG
jgi:hypothetical protein